VEEHRYRWRIGRMCSLLNLSASGYYAWRKRPTSKRSLENARLLESIRHIYAEGRGEYGSPTICGTLRDAGSRVNHKRIARLMQLAGLCSKIRRKFKCTTRRCKDQDASPNLLQQNFTTDRPNRVWVSDITYVWTEEGWLYLTTVVDICSRKVIGHAITDHLRAEAVIQALEMALSRRAIAGGLVFHSDRGKQYADHRVRKILSDNKITQSMSSTGNCYDNAMAESFFATFKRSHIFGEPFQTKEEARRMIFEYLEVFYNRVRRHSSLGYKSPVAFEQHHETLA
jgi:putative transposase